MRITNTAIKRGVTFFMIYLIAVFFGLFSLSQLNVDLYPDLEFPILAIITQYTGVGPFDIETVITRPLEETVSSVQNIKKVTSTSTQGLSLVSLEFEWGTDMDQAEIDVRNNLEYIRDMLPDDISQPMVFAFDVSSQPVLYLAVTSELHGQAELRRISEHDIEPRMERIAGVASAFTAGGMKREIKVQADPLRMRAYQISMDQLVGSLRANNMQMPSGWIENEEQEFTLRTAGEYTSIEQIENTVIGYSGDSKVQVKDVATVIDGFADQRQKVWNNNKPAVMMVIQKQSDANTVTVCENVVSQLDRIESELPKGITLDTVIDFSTFIKRSISNLGNTALQAVLLTFLVLLFFLRNIRSSLIVAASIPVSIIVSFGVMHQAGLTLNMISMAGLALAVGLLVDNSIVVLESIFRHRELKESARDAAANGTNEVAMAITASTLTTLAVFVPVLFVPGIAGEMFNDMVVTLVLSLTISLIVALTLVPLLSSRFLVIQQNLSGRKGIIKRIGDSVGRGLSRLQEKYHSSLQWALQHRWLVVLSTLGLFILAVFAMANLGGEFIPENDMGFIAIAVDRTPGTSLEAMEESMHKMNQIILDEVPEVEIVYSNFGQGEGIMAFFSSRSSSEGDITIRLKKLSERDRSMFEIQDVLREKFKNLPDVDARFEDRGQAAMFGSGTDIMVEIFGHDLDVSEALAYDILERVKKIEGVADVTTSFKESAPELRIELDRQRIADLGLSTAQIGQVVSTSVLGTVATEYRESGDEYDIRVQLSKEARNNKEDIENIVITTPMGKQIPLRSVADVVYTKAPKEITREDQERMVSVNISLSGRDLTSVTSDVEDVLKGVAVPNDYRLEIGGTAEEQQESFMYLGLAFLVAILLTYMVMASQFESFLDPFVIMFTIPMSFIGVAMGLIFTGTDLSVMSLIGMVMLVGIVVNNGIVLVDYINQLREQGLSLQDAILEGGNVRMRPVLMTALTTILAMFPLALGLGESGQSWAPMARAVMGGLTMATVLTLIVVPVIYAILETLAAKVKAKFARRSEQKVGGEVATDEA